MNTLNLQEIRTFENRLCEHGDFLSAKSAIEKLMCYGGLKPKGMILSGPPGTGKTRLCESIKDEKNRQLLAANSNQSKVVYVNTALCTSPNQVVSAVLEELGDIKPDQGTLKTKTTRAVRLLKEHGVALIVLDECHDFMPKSDIKPTSNVYRFIKGFMDECRVPFLLIGTNRTEALLEVDKQLATRFLPTQSLYAFNVCSETEKIRFALVIDSILGQFPRKTKGLSFVQVTEDENGQECYQLVKSHNDLYRLTLATGGLMRSLMSLLSECLELTKTDETVTREVLVKAYDNVIHSSTGKNPFDTKSMPIKQVKNALKKEGLYDVN